MGVGNLKVEVRTGDGALPVKDADVAIKDGNGQILYQLKTDSSGNTETVALSAPDKESTLAATNAGPYYSVCNVEISHQGFVTNIIRDVQIFDTVSSILPVNMTPMSKATKSPAKISTIPANGLLTQVGRNQVGPLVVPAAKVLKAVVIPEYITVHLAHPDVAARNIRVKFIDYIKNVGSSEIYPTWPESSLEANIHCQITFALNRIYTEWYRSRGYPFDISNSTSVDQFYVEDRNIFDSISHVVDRIFNMYVRRAGRKEPFFTQFCNGTTATCPGLSQWGTVPLAENGLTPLQILKHYYPNDVEIVETEHTVNVSESYPGVALKEGDQGHDVEIMQRYLNRIRANYPLIPQITNPNGVFGSDTTAAVKTFQSIFDLTPDGIIGKSTWYKISYLYVAVTNLADLESEGQWIGIGETPPTVVLKEGSKGSNVALLQFLLDYLSEFYPSITPVIQDGTFRATTKTAVMQFQQLFNLTPDGIVGPATWNVLYQAYQGVEESIPPSPEPGPGSEPEPEPEQPSGTTPPYPGHLLRWGSRGDNVLLMQQYLKALSNAYPSIPNLTPDGIFGQDTYNAVIAFQRQFGLSVDGIIGPTTWNKIVEAYNQLNTAVPYPEYPGYLLRLGSVGNDVESIQKYLADLSNAYPSIPKPAVDGIFGSGTQRAVLAFQKLFGLSQDGVVGPATWAAITAQHAKL